MRHRNGLCWISLASLWGVLLSVAMGTVIGCASPPVENRGRTNQIPTDSRGPVSHGQLGSKELENTTDVMLESIVSSLEDLERDEYGNTVIVVGDFVNRSYVPTYDMEIFLAQLRRKLNQSGAAYQLVFVERPDRAEAVRSRVLEEGLKDDYETPGTRPQYALTGEVYAIEESGARYWEVFFKLLDLDPNARYRNEIRWENSAGYRFAR